jgi:cardiolipin synthase A/B
MAWPDWTLVYLIYVISEWVIRLIMLVFVPPRRSPAAARTWLLIIFIVPWVGLALYSLFGRTNLPRRRRPLLPLVEEQIKSARTSYFQSHSVHPELSPHLAPVVTLAQNLGDFPIVGGNHIQLLSDYDGAIARLVADIDAAQHHVHLLYYIFATDRTGNQVADALARAARRGVQCRLLLDSFGSRHSRRQLARTLAPLGIEVLELLPISLFRRNRARLDLRNHRKIAIVDGRVGYVGSQNVVDAEFKRGIIYEELVARVTGPAVRQLQAVFWADRYFETEQAGDRSEYFPAPELTGSSPAQVLPSGPTYPQQNNHRMIVSLVHNARERVVITTPYFIPEIALLVALKTAVQRGVGVHLVFSLAADQHLVGLAQRSYYQELLEAGIQIHLYKAGFLHAKHLTIDNDIALIGSSNLDIRSFLLNAELSLLIYDPQVVAELRVLQERYFAGAILLTLERWQPGFMARTAQNIARLVDALL